MQVRKVLRSSVFDVECLEFSDPQGHSIERHVVRHPGAVVVVPELDDGRLVFIRNHRVAVGEWLYEFCAGKLEGMPLDGLRRGGEDPAHAARRELEEETGYSAHDVKPLGSFYTSPGFTDELMHAFHATGLRQVPQRLEPGERIEVEVIEPARAEVMIRDGELRDGKSIAAFHLWKMVRHGASLPARPGVRTP